MNRFSLSKIPVYISILFLAVPICLFAQNGIEDEVRKMDDPPYLLIEKTRHYLYKTIKSANFDKAEEIYNYLQKVEKESDYLGLYAAEKWLLLYLLQDYDSLLESIRFIEENPNSYSTKLVPREDFLYALLAENALNSKEEMLAWLYTSETSAEEKSFLDLKLRYLLNLRFPIEEPFQDVADRAIVFVRESSDQFYINYVNKYILNKVNTNTPSHWKFGINFLGGADFYSGQLRENFSNTGTFGMHFELYYKRLMLVLANKLGANTTRQSITIENEVWPTRSPARTFQPTLLMGASLVKRETFEAYIMSGVQWFSIDPTENNLNANPSWEVFKSGVTSNPQVAIGFTYFPLTKRYNRNFDENTYIRLQYDLSAIKLKHYGHTNPSAIHGISINFGGKLDIRKNAFRGAIK